MHMLVFGSLACEAVNFLYKHLLTIAAAYLSIYLFKKPNYLCLSTRVLEKCTFIKHAFLMNFFCQLSLSV